MSMTDVEKQAAYRKRHHDMGLKQVHFWWPKDMPPPTEADLAKLRDWIDSKTQNGGSETKLS
jgi:hypothetical protein